MNGRNVLQPMGWDAFGLPADENAAIANRVPPAKWTLDNIAHMKAQLKSLGYGLDWNRELTTCLPEYYRWEPVVVSAHAGKGRRVSENRRGELGPGRQNRAGERTSHRRLRLAYRRDHRKARNSDCITLKITAYAEDLLEALNGMPDWPERVRAMQANWIGRSEGVRLGFSAQDRRRAACCTPLPTRADTIMGVTFCAVAAAEHRWRPLRRVTTQNWRLYRGVQTRSGGR